MDEAMNRDQERQAKHTAGEAIYQLERALKKLKKVALTPVELEALETELQRLKAALLILQVIDPGF